MSRANNHSLCSLHSQQIIPRIEHRWERMMVPVNVIFEVLFSGASMLTSCDRAVA